MNSVKPKQTWGFEKDKETCPHAIRAWSVWKGIRTVQKGESQHHQYLDGRRRGKGTRQKEASPKHRCGGKLGKGHDPCRREEPCIISAGCECTVEWKAANQRALHQQCSGYLERNMNVAAGKSSALSLVPA